MSQALQRQRYLRMQQGKVQEYFTKEPCFIHLWNYISASPKYIPLLLGTTEVRNQLS